MDVQHVLSADVAVEKSVLLLYITPYLSENTFDRLAPLAVDTIPEDSYRFIKAIFVLPDDDVSACRAFARSEYS